MHSSYLHTCVFLQSCESSLLAESLADIPPGAMAACRSKARKTARCDAVASSARFQSSVLLSNAFVESVPLVARDLAKFCLTSKRHAIAAAEFVRAAMASQHGLVFLDGTLADLLALEGVPSELAVDLRKPTQGFQRESAVRHLRRRLQDARDASTVSARARRRVVN